MSKLKSSVYSTIYPLESYLSQGYQHTVKCKQPCPRFELGSLCLFSTMITITTQRLPIYKSLSIFSCIYIYINWLNGLESRVFANGLWDWGSIPGRVIPKIFKKWYLMPPCLTLSIIRYVSRIKWSNLRKGVAPSPTLWCCSYWRGSLWVTLN